MDEQLQILHRNYRMNEATLSREWAFCVGSGASLNSPMRLGQRTGPGDGKHGPKYEPELAPAEKATGEMKTVCLSGVKTSVCWPWPCVFLGVCSV